MRNKIVVLIVGLLFVVPLSAQENRPHSVLVKRFVGKVKFDSMQEYALRIDNFRGKASKSSEVNVVIRLCTNESFAIAVARSALAFPAIVEIFDGYQFDRNNIIILKSEGCSLAKLRSTIATELWVTDRVDSLPPFSEKYLATDSCFTKMIGPKSTQLLGGRNLK